MKKLKIWFISDTHTKHKQLEIPKKGFDMVIHSGDAGTTKGTSFNEAEIREFIHWFAALPCKYKIFVPGNHDTSIEAGLWTKEEIESYGITVLINDTVEIEGIKIFGSPYTPSFGHGWAYNTARHKMERHWNLIEEGTDIIITHGPAHDHLDLTKENVNAGCKTLLHYIGKINPEIVVSGHIHEDGGKILYDAKYPATRFINAAVMNLRYNVTNNGHILEI